MSIADSITDHVITAVFTLGGGIIGAIATFAATIIYKEYDLNLKIKEKLIEKRIAAHDQIFLIVEMLRSMVSMQELDQQGILKRFPKVLSSEEKFIEWNATFAACAGKHSNWVANEVVREIHLIQDYMINLGIYLKRIDSSNYPHAGNLIRSDFIDLAQRLEKSIKRYFSKGIKNLDSEDINLKHKHDQEITHKYLDSSAFYAKKEELKQWVRPAVGT